MNEPLHPVLVLDNHDEDLGRFTKRYPNAVAWNPSTSGAATPAEAVESAISLLKKHRPSTVILDLRWHTGTTYYDGIRFLRRACEADLLDGLHLVVWSKYLTEAERALAPVMPALSLAGIRSVTRVPKVEVPQIEALGS